ncbi:MAG: DUF3899 domain-containing protein [Lachnospiraceae bacterium]|nr:DUF3899 domain-containing protein [Lachnospiraceae bacterium]
MIGVFMSIIRKLILHSPGHYIAAFVIAAGFSGAMLFTRGASTTVLWMDALTVGGAVTALFGLLLLVTRLGSFDLFSYSFRRFSGRTDKDFYEFREQAEEKRSKEEYTFMPYILVGLLFIVVGLVIRAI